MIKQIKYKNDEEWRSIRRRYIGGSDAGAAAGMNPYKSRYTLWAEKTGRLPEFEGNLTTEVGAYLEAFVAEQFCRATKKKVRRENCTFVNDKYPFACANIDRKIVGENALLEIKTTNSPPAMKKLRSGEYPEAWYCQMTHYLAVTGMEKAYLAVLIGGRKFEKYELERDEDEIEALMEAEREFWELVKSGQAPEVGGESCDTAAVTGLYTESDGRTVSLFGLERYMREYLDLSARIKELNLLKENAANHIKEYMKTAEKGESGSYKVTWIPSERKSFDLKRFEAEHGDIDLSGYYNTSNTRIFRVTEI